MADEQKLKRAKLEEHTTVGVTTDDDKPISPEIPTTSEAGKWDKVERNPRPCPRIEAVPQHYTGKKLLRYKFPIQYEAKYGKSLKTEVRRIKGIRKDYKGEVEYLIDYECDSTNSWTNEKDINLDQKHVEDYFRKGGKWWKLCIHSNYRTEGLAEWPWQRCGESCRRECNCKVCMDREAKGLLGNVPS